MPTQPRKFDVIIAGAGPAGTTCALALGKSGLRVALLDKYSFPRDKTCGDAVAQYAVKVLRSIDPVYAAAYEAFFAKEAIRTLRFFAPNGRSMDVTFDQVGNTCARLKFDEFMFGLASGLDNVTVFENMPVTNVVISNEQVTVYAGADTVFEAGLIIGCDGATGVVSKKLTDTRLDRRYHSGAVRAYFENLSGMNPGAIELHLIKDLLPGYFWIFPMPGNTANVGLGQVSSSIAKSKVNLRERLLELIESSPGLKERFKDAKMTGVIQGAGLPLGSRKVTVSGHRFMLCGDAAALIDPLSGEGIGQAMVSGRYAGWQAITCFQENKFDALFLKQYDKQVYDKMWKEHQRHYWAMRTIGNRAWVPNAVVNLAGLNPFLNRAVRKLLW